MELRVWWLAVGLIVALVGCRPEATPMPVFLPETPTPTPPPGALPPLQYALLGYDLTLLPDLSLIQSSAEVIRTDDPNADADVLVTYGEREGWTRSELTLHVSLILADSLTPEIASIVRRSLNPGEVLTALQINGAAATPLESVPASSLRTELANLGYPDGVGLVLSVTPVPGTQAIIEQLQAANIEIQALRVDARTALETNRIQAALVVWALDSERETWVSRFGADNVIDLYQLPISYRVKPDLKVSFTPSGFPLVSR